MAVKDFHPLKFIKANKVISVVLLMIVIYVVLSLAAAAEVRLDKHKFEKARKNIDIIYNDIVAKVGQPDDYKRTNDCSRPNQEWSQGPLSCTVSSNLLFGVGNLSEANVLFKNVQATINNHPNLFKVKNPQSTEIGATLLVNTYSYGAFDKYSSYKNMDCSVKYTYDTARDISLHIKNESKKPLQIDIGCSGWAKAQYYPMHSLSNLYQ